MAAAVPLPAGACLPEVGERGHSIDDLRPGDEACVRAVRGTHSVRRRLMELGFVSGTRVRVVRLAPFADPMQIELHGYHISLRRSEARTILVDAC